MCQVPLAYVAEVASVTQWRVVNGRVGNSLLLDYDSDTDEGVSPFHGIPQGRVKTRLDGHPTEVLWVLNDLLK